METLEPSWSASRDERHCEVQSSISGFWSVDTIHEYFDGVNKAANPLVRARKPIFALVDFANFIPQDRATGDAIRDHLMMSVKFGLKRTAILGASPLTSLQYKRLSSGVEVQFLDDKAEAKKLLRS